jgi:trehalose-6-phosphate synthase
MPLAERRERHGSLFRVLSRNDIQNWANHFQTALERKPQGFKPARANAPCGIVMYRRPLRLNQCDVC